MTEFDPFAAALAENEPVNDNQNDSKEKPVTEASNAKVSATVKEHAGFDASWIVFCGDTVEEVYHQVMDAYTPRLMDAVQTAHAHFSKNAKPSAGRPSGGGQAPAGQPGQPAGSTTFAPSAKAKAKFMEQFGSEEVPAGWSPYAGIAKTGPNAGKAYQAWRPPQGSGLKWIYN